MNFVVAVIPPQSVQDVANSYRKRYDPLYNLIPPHIKLTEIFYAHPDQMANIDHFLRQVAHQTDSFSVKIHKVSHFHPTNNVLYLAIQDEQPLIALHHKIYEASFLPERTYAYVPHLTIGQRLSDDELHDVYGQLRMKKFELEFTVDRFHLLKETENRTWIIDRTYPLT